MAKLLTDYKNIVTKSDKSYKQVTAKSDSRVLWKSGAIVTYMVDTATKYTEEVDSGASALSPTTFTPTKSGWTFVGWREDTAASDSVLTSKTCEGEPFTLYAVFKKDVTVTFYSGSASATSEKATGTRYYNYGNTVNASVTAPSGATMSGWTWLGWGSAKSTEASSSASYANGATISGLTDDTWFRGLYKRTLTLTYYDNSTTAKTKEGTNYYNSYGTHAYPSFKMTQAASTSGMTCRGWSTTNAGNATVNYANGATIELTGNLTIYGMYEQALTLTYYDNSTTAKTKSGTKYWAPAGYIYPSFKLAQASKSGWSARGWSGSNAAAGSIAYQNNTDFSISDNTTIYGCYQKTCTCTFRSYNSSVDREGTAYYNSSGNEQGATVTAPNGASYSGWSWRGWSTGGATAADAAVTFANGASVGLGTASHTVYGLYQQTITVSYYAVSNSTKQQKTGTRYHNSAGNYKNPTFSISPSGYGSEWTFRGWTTGTSANADVTYDSINNREFSSNITLYILLQRQVTLSYNGNGATGGSVSAQTGYVYLNSYGTNTVLNPTFKLRANGFTRTNYEFTGWDLGAVGASVTLSANATAKAQWKVLAVPYTINSGWNLRTWNVSYNDNTDNHYYQALDTSVEVCAVNHGNSGMEGLAVYTTLNTQNCNRIKVSYHSTHTHNTIMGSEVGSTGYGDKIISISGSTIDFIIGAKVGGTASGNVEGDEGSLIIYSVEFYYE